MIERGSKIKLVNEMGMFTNIGEVCEVVDVSDKGMISFRFGGGNLGVMSPDELDKYFEVVVEEETVSGYRSVGEALAEAEDLAIDALNYLEDNFDDDTLEYAGLHAMLDRLVDMI